MTAGLDVNLSHHARKAASEWRIPSSNTELLRANPKETLWQRVLAWIFLIAGFAFYFYIARNETFPPTALVSHFKSFVLIGVSVGILVFLLTRLSNDINLGRGLKRLQTKMAEVEACPVRIVIWQNDTITGIDEGFAWLEDGILYYKGLQCIFRLSPEEVKPLDQWPAKRRPVPEDGRMPEWLLLETEHRKTVMSLKLIDPFEDFNIRRRSHRFQMGLTKWLRERPSDTIEGVLPPLAVHPCLLRTDTMQYEGVGTGLVLVMISFLMLLFCKLDFNFVTAAGIVNIFQFFIGLGILFVSVRFAWQQHCDLINRRAIFLEEQLKF